MKLSITNKDIYEEIQEMSKKSEVDGNGKVSIFDQAQWWKELSWVLYKPLSEKSVKRRADEPVNKSDDILRQ